MAHPRQGIFLPHARYEAGEDSKFYTASTVCTLGRIFSDSSLIQPAWTKVATSPWGEAARVTGGYGERVLNGANSVESPDFMFSKVRTACGSSSIPLSAHYVNTFAREHYTGGTSDSRRNRFTLDFENYYLHNRTNSCPIHLLSGFFVLLLMLCYVDRDLEGM